MVVTHLSSCLCTTSILKAHPWEAWFEKEIYWIMEGVRSDRAAVSENQLAHGDYNTAIFWLRWKAETLQTLLGVYSVNFFHLKHHNVSDLQDEGWG